MKQVWLFSNRRILIVFFLASMMLAVAGACAMMFTEKYSSGFLLAGLVVLIGLAFTARFLFSLTVPRLAYRDGKLLVYVVGFRPIRLPIEIVEVFFIGQGGSRLKTAAGQELENSTIVVRLAESATEWHQRKVHAKLGHWCDGYITLRGAWCEPLNVDVVRRLNQRLLQAKKADMKKQPSHG